MKITLKKKKIGDTTTVLEALREQGYYINAPCSGKGTCGKCKVKVLEGKVSLNENNLKKLSQMEIDEGICLSCSSFIKEDCIISLGVSSEEFFQVLTSYEDVGSEGKELKYKIINLNINEDDLKKGMSITSLINSNLRYKYIYSLKATKKLAPYVNKSQKKELNNNLIIEGNRVIDISNDEEAYGIAMDIGTTTIVLSLVQLISGKVIRSYSAINSGRKYGADVISRIDYSLKGNIEELKENSISDILKGIKDLISSGYKKEKVYDIIIAGNTTMLYLLLGMPCESLASYPFNTTSLELIEGTFKEIFGSDALDAKVTLLPGASAYVGADIMAGILKSGIYKSEKIQMLLDIGTNGEMAIGNKDKILCLATAAGPAFEGANITCGTGSIKGAICEVNIQKGKVDYKTIKDAPPVGICGSAVIDIGAAFLREGIIDETGRFNEDQEEDLILIAKKQNEERIIFNQKDIRELQLAKSAIRAGIEILIKNYGCRYEDIDKMMLAGAFGNKINLENASYIGLIPKELENKAVNIGNSSLGGAISYLINISGREDLNKIIQITEYIDISSDKEFSNLFIENMLF